MKKLLSLILGAMLLLTACGNEPAGANTSNDAASKSTKPEVRILETGKIEIVDFGEVVINGMPVIFGETKVSEYLEYTGYTLSEYSCPEVLGPGEYKEKAVVFIDSATNSYSVADLWVANNTDEELPNTECTIDGFSVVGGAWRDIEVKSDFKILGLTFGEASYEDVKEILGDPDRYSSTLNFRKWLVHDENGEKIYEFYIWFDEDDIMSGVEMEH